MKIGIPRALFYYEQGSKFEQFFKGLGFEVVISKETDNEIYNEGLKKSPSELCLPVKVYVGHILWLNDKCDIVFIPRIKNKQKFKFSCPNILGLPDLVKNMLPNVKFISTDFKDDLESYIEIATKLGAGRIKALESYVRLKQIKEVKELKFDDDKINIAIVGRSYYVADKKLNLDLKKKLEELGVNVVTSNDIDIKEIEKSQQINSNLEKYDSHWTNVDKLLNSIKYFDNHDKVDGIIYIKPFNCGPDFLVEQLAKIKKMCLILKLDEHSSETGILTRLEAFMDILKK